MLISKYGSIERVIEAAMTGKPSTVMAKVASSLDYLDRAAKVVLITSKAPVGEIDLKRPRGEADPRIEEAASNYGLLGQIRRLLAALGRNPTELGN